MTHLSQVTVLLPCGHSKDKECYVDINSIKCYREVTKTLKESHKY